MGYEEMYWYTFNGKKVTLSYKHTYNQDTGKHVYKKGKKKITKSAYNKAVKSMKKKATVIKFNNMHFNSSANRQKYLK